jgi:signal peptidase I
LLGSLAHPIPLPLLGPTPAYYLLLLALFIFYIFTKLMLVGLLAGALMVFIVIYEFFLGVREGGLKKELLNTALAILVAVMVWFGSGFVLQTPTPINAIVSCSMRPAYERGDLVLLAGGPIKAPVYAYAGKSTDINSTAIVSDGQTSWPAGGSWLAYCTAHLSDDTRCRDFASRPDAFVETHGPLELHYGACTRQEAGSGKPLATTICVTQTRFNGQMVPDDKASGPNGDLIVYSPKPGDLFSRVGDIVHRARVGINASDGLVYLTKGDNNPVYDLQAYDPQAGIGNSPISPSQVKGHVWLRIPYIGNLKLFITPQVLADPSSLSGCESHFASQYR